MDKKGFAGDLVAVMIVLIAMTFLAFLVIGISYAGEKSTATENAVAQTQSQAEKDLLFFLQTETSGKPIQKVIAEEYERKDYTNFNKLVMDFFSKKQYDDWNVLVYEEIDDKQSTLYDSQNFDGVWNLNLGKKIAEAEQIVYVNQVDSIKKLTVVLQVRDNG